MSDSDEFFEDDSLLYRAVVTGNEKVVRNLIAAGCDVNEDRNYGEPLLAIAIRKNHLAIVRILLNAGAIYENSFYDRKYGPLHLAAYYGCLEIVQLFIKLGVDVNSRTKELETTLYCAAQLNDGKDSDIQCKIINTLVDAGADINSRCCTDSSPLVNAAESGFYAGFQLLLSMGADIYKDGKIDSVLLNSAGYSTNLEIVKWAIEHGFDINTTWQDSNTPLHQAAYLSRSEIVEFLLNNGAVIKINEQNEDPLCCAIDFWCNEDYDSLSDDDHDQEIEENFNQIYIEHMKCLDLLITHGANINRANHRGKTPLTIVLENFEYMHSNFVRILLKNGAVLDFNHPSVRNVMNSTDESKFPRLLLRHVAMFEAQGRSDGLTNFDLSKLSNESRKDYTRCLNELEQMKTTKIDETNVSFYNVLVNKDIGPYTRNKNIRNAFETSNVSKRFPIYSDLVTDRFSEELEFQELKAKAAVGLGHVLNWDVDSTRIILDKILLYLDKKDLTNLAEI